MLGGKTVIKKWGILGDPGADSGGKGKTKRAEKNGAKKSKERSLLFFASFFFRPFSLSLAPTISPWVSEDGNECFKDKKREAQKSWIKPLK